MARRKRADVRERWQCDVLGYDPACLPDAVKVTLLALSLPLWMTAQGYVSVPRGDIAALVKKDPRTVDRHVALAIKHGLLQKVGGGYRGTTAMYAAVLSGPERVTERVTLSEDQMSPFLLASDRKG